MTEHIARRPGMHRPARALVVPLTAAAVRVALYVHQPASRSTCISLPASYGAFAYWLPLIPGTIAYLQLVQRVHRWRRLDG